jgi:proteasome lid subunit RPN8/RPN11
LAETLHLAGELREVMVAHCLDALPNEGCGLYAVDGHRVVEVYPTANADQSPRSFTVPPEEHYAALADATGRGWSLGGSFHSHPGGRAEPSGHDLAGALEPEWVYLVVGLRGEPEVRAWRIRRLLEEEVMLAPP